MRDGRRYSGSISNSGDEHFYDYWALTETYIESIDEEDIKSNGNILNEVTGNSKFNSSSVSNLNSTFGANKSRTIKYFVNNYDNFSLNGPIFKIKRMDRKITTNKDSIVSNRKRNRQFDDAHIRAKELNQADDETRQKKAFKITKSSDKKEIISNKDTPEYSTDFDKHIKENKSKISNDTIPSPNTAPTDFSIAPAQKVAPRKKEDKKGFQYKGGAKKAPTSASLEPFKKINEDDFADFLFRDTRKKTREPKKVSRSILDQPITHFNLNEDRVK
jgi:hypothetical protein